MKVNEIVREERLNEFVPLLTIPMMFSGILAALKVKGIYEIYDVLSKNGYDIDNMSSDDKLNLFITFVLLFVPGGGKFTNEVIMRMLPGWAKRKAIETITDFLKQKGPELKAIRDENRRKYTSRPGASAKRQAKDRKKLAAANRKTTREYQSMGKAVAVEKLKGPVYTVIGGLALLPLAYTYYGKLSDLETQYAAYKGGDKDTEIFADSEPNPAYRKYSELRNKYIGELTIGVTAALARTPIGNLVKGFNTVVGNTLGAAFGPVGRALIKMPGNIAMKLATATGPAVVVLMQTDAGQKFLSSSIVEFITGVTGIVTTTILTAAAKGIDLALKTVGVQSNIAGVVAPQAAPPGYYSATPTRNFDRLAIYANKENPNIKYIRGVQVTTPDGYLKNNIANILDGIKDNARLANRPNPVDQLKRNPNLEYKTA